MTLRQKQSKFAHMVSTLIAYIYECGYEVTFGDAARMDNRGHCTNSLHYKRLAIDLNLFRNGRYMNKSEDHKPFGLFWESMGGSWGGRFKDGNHYSLGEGRGSK